MVLESILQPKDVVRHPVYLMVLTFVFVSLAVWESLSFGGGNTGLFFIALVAIPVIPIVLRLFASQEEEIEIDFEKRVLGSSTLARYFPIIITLAAYFLSLILSFTAWFIYLPPEQSGTLFALQLQELKDINAGVKALFGGYATYDFLGGAVNGSFLPAFELIFFHNLQVLALVIGFSVLYGSGAILILTWNASVIAAFLGSFAIDSFLKAPGEYALYKGIGYGLLGLLPHGTFELVSYLMAALAGGLLSSAVIRKAYARPEFALISHDVAKLTAWSILLLAIGALIESGGIAG
jgi:uncharacterized membrane protein SpoIIM required for sporulation